MRTSKKGLLARGFVRARIPATFLSLASQPGRVLVLAYHRVCEIGEESSFPYDPELVSASPEDFAWQMEFVSRHFDPITFRQLLELGEKGIRPSRRALIVTFDDGHLDNYEVAFPILKALGMPATIFLSTGYIGGRGTFWFDRVAHLLYCAPSGRLEIAEVGFGANLHDVPSRRAAAESLLSILKKVQDRQRLEAVERLEELVPAGCRSNEGGSAAMDWDQVREMQQSGIEFGSHSVSHPVLSNLEDDALHRELSESRRTIEEQTGAECRVFAYPVGSGAFDPRVVAATRRAGYKLGVSYASGVNAIDDLDRYAVRRLHVERYTSRAYFQSVLALPGIFG